MIKFTLKQQAIIITILIFLGCVAVTVWGDEEFIGKVYLDDIKMWYQFTEGEVVYKGETSVVLCHEEDGYGTTWCIIDGVHPIEKVIFYKDNQ